MAIGKEVGNLISAFEKLRLHIEQGHCYTEEEFKALIEMAHMIDLETSLYRLEHLLPASDTTH